VRRSSAGPRPNTARSRTTSQREQSNQDSEISYHEEPPRRNIPQSARTAPPGLASDYVDLYQALHHANTQWQQDVEEDIEENLERLPLTLTLHLPTEELLGALRERDHHQRKVAKARWRDRATVNTRESAHAAYWRREHARRRWKRFLGRG
ncbi:unnamed protein product, partial [Heterosigma akashiwo]